MCEGAQECTPQHHCNCLQRKAKGCAIKVSEWTAVSRGVGLEEKVTRQFKERNAAGTVQRARLQSQRGGLSEWFLPARAQMKQPFSGAGDCSHTFHGALSCIQPACLTCSLAQARVSVQGSPPENFGGHVAIRSCLPCQPEFAFEVIAGMLIDGQ